LGTKALSSRPSTLLLNLAVVCVAEKSGIWWIVLVTNSRSCLINNPKPETPRMRPAIKAGLRSFAEAEKAYMRQLGSVEIPTRVVILSGVWRVLGAKRSRRTCGFSAKSDNIPCDKSRPVEGREHVNKARQLLLCGQESDVASLLLEPESAESQRQGDHGTPRDPISTPKPCTAPVAALRDESLRAVHLCA